MANDKDFKIKNGLQLGGAFIEKVGTIAGNATLDLSTGNVFDYTPTADATFVFNNAGETEHSFVLSVTGADIGASYDIANASYDGVSFSVAAQDTSPVAITFNNAGTKMFVSGFTGVDINEYFLSTAFDISTASYTQNFSVESQDKAPSGVRFNPDGTKMYVTCGFATRAVYQYSLSTGFDLSTASYDSISLDLASQTQSPSGLVFNSDGTKVFIAGNYPDNKVYQYSLPTAYNFNAASYDNVSFDVSAQTTSVRSPNFNLDGSKLFLVSSSLAVLQYSLSTNYDITTASYDSVSFNIDSGSGLTFNANGSKMYIVNGLNDAVFQYTTGTSDIATFTYPASVYWPSGTTPDAPAVGETDILEFSTTDGGTVWYGIQRGDNMS